MDVNSPGVAALAAAARAAGSINETVMAHRHSIGVETRSHHDAVEKLMQAQTLLGQAIQQLQQHSPPGPIGDVLSSAFPQ